MVYAHLVHVDLRQIHHHLFVKLSVTFTRNQVEEACNHVNDSYPDRRIQSALQQYQDIRLTRRKGDSVPIIVTLKRGSTGACSYPMKGQPQLRDLLYHWV